MRSAVLDLARCQISLHVVRMMDSESIESTSMDFFWGELLHRFLCFKCSVPLHVF